MAINPICPDLPEVTEDHREAAFISLRWLHVTYEQAISDPARRAVIEETAQRICKREWQTRNTVNKPALRR